MNAHSSQQISIGLQQVAQALAQFHQATKGESNSKSISGLPNGVGFLLHVANGDLEQLVIAMQATGADPKTLQQACLAFIEHRLAENNADPYRVLGTTSMTSFEEIRSHYRLLIRLFHPDRNIAKPEVSEVYSANINHAYTIISQTVGHASVTSHAKVTPSIRLRAKKSTPAAGIVYASEEKITVPVLAFALTRFNPFLLVANIGILAIISGALLLYWINSPAQRYDFLTITESINTTLKNPSVPEIKSRPADPSQSLQTGQIKMLPAPSQESGRKNHLVEPVSMPGISSSSDQPDPSMVVNKKLPVPSPLQPSEIVTEIRAATEIPTPSIIQNEPLI